MKAGSGGAKSVAGREDGRGEEGERCRTAAVRWNPARRRASSAVGGGENRVEPEADMAATTSAMVAAM